MNKRRMAETALLFFLVIALAGIAIAAQPYYPQQASATNVASAAGFGFSTAFQRLNNFFQGGYYSYQKVVDFAILFLLLSTASLIGLKKWMGEQNRQVTALAFIVGFMMALTLVLSTDFTLAGLFPFAKGFLFLIGVIIVYSLLRQAGMDKHPILAFILAVIIVFLFFYLAGWVTNTGASTGGIGGFRTQSPGKQLSSLFKSTGQTLPKGEATTLYECKYGPIKNAFELDKALPTYTGSSGEFRDFNDFADSCKENAKINAYASRNEKNQKELSLNRAKEIMKMLSSKGVKDIKIVDYGVTDKFQTLPPDTDEKSKDFDEFVKNNRAYEITCQCEKEGLLDKAKEQYSDLMEGPESCIEATRMTLESIARTAVETAKEYGTNEPKKNEIAEYERIIGLCDNDYKAKKIDAQTYNSAIVKFETARGKAYFEIGFYTEARKAFEEIAVKTRNEDAAREGLETYYSMIYDRFNKDRSAIKQFVDGKTPDGMKERIKWFASIREEVEKAKDAMMNAKYYTYKPLSFGVKPENEEIVD
ncbi:hypothetical protein JXA85_05505 [Candidatus Woesearchaeota archaeon]|nr:hypothetical protein [Candidatus Woesearchaeota archaeon]